MSVVSSLLSHGLEQLTIGGVDPLTRADKLIGLAKKMREVAPKVLLCIRTNGSMILDCPKLQEAWPNNAALELLPVGESHRFQDRLLRVLDHKNIKTIMGRPTYEVVLDNVVRNFGDYQNINTVCCYDMKSDLFDLLEFYETNDRRNRGHLPPLLHAHQIVADFSDFYDNVTESERNKFRHQSNELLSLYIERLSEDKKPPIFCSALFSGDLFLIAERQKFIWGNSLFSCPTATCCPGDKLLVNPNGSLDLCERGPITRKPLGSVQDGFDFKATQEVVNQYNAHVLSCCSKCNVSRLCPKCFATTEDDPYYHLDNSSCKAIRRTIEKRLSVYATIMERNPNAFSQTFGQ